RKGIVVGPIETLIEIAHQLRECQLRLPVAIVDCGIDQTGIALVIGDQVAAPEVAMQQSRGLFGHRSRKLPAKSSHSFFYRFNRKAIVSRQLDLGFESLLNIKFSPYRCLFVPLMK